MCFLFFVAGDGEKDPADGRSRFESAVGGVDNNCILQFSEDDLMSISTELGSKDEGVSHG